jgi:DNA-binding IclR family transcriptional regulator
MTNHSRAARAKYPAPALEKGLDILEHLSMTGAPQSQAEIAQALGRSPNELYRMFTCLEERRYLVRDPQQGKYRLSLKLYHLGHTHSHIEFLRNAALAPMKRLAETTQQSCHLSIIHEDSLMAVMRVRSPLPVALSIEEGSYLPLLRTTSGKLLLAFTDERERQDILGRSERFRGMSHKRRKDFCALLKKIQSQGFYIAQSELMAGVTDISVLVGRPGGAVMASLSMPCITTALAEAMDEHKYLHAAKDCAEEINRAIGIEPRRNGANGL